MKPLSAKNRHANIGLFVPHLGCPKRCSFCDQNTITGANFSPPPTPEDVLSAAQVAAETCRAPEDTEIAFFGGSFTAIDRAYMVSLLDAAKWAAERYGFHGVRCSTRPDAIDRDVLRILKAYRVTAIELGAQSMDDGVLAANHRGHTAQDTREAARLIQEGGFELGLQMMTGLYGSTVEADAQTARELIALEPATARIYPTIVLPGTGLAALYQSGAYQPQALDDAVEACAGLLGMFRQAGVRVIRLGLHAGPELEQNMLAGPYHPAFRQLVESRVFLRELLDGLEPRGPGRYAVAVNPRDISTALGQGRGNLRRLEDLGYQVGFVQDPALGPGERQIL